MSIDWTEEREALARKLAAEGKSGSQIAAEIGEGCTRNAVIGIAHRKKIRLIGKPPGVRGSSVAVTVAPSRPRPSIEKIARTHKALEEGRKDIAGIAEEVGLSVNVVRKISKQRGPSRKMSQRTVEDARVRERIRVIQRRKADPGAPPVIGYKAERFTHGFEGQQGRLELRQLNDKVCKFPIDMPADAKGKIETRYCGCEAKRGSYCADHAARCYDGPVAAKPRKGTGMPLRGIAHVGWY